MDDIVGLINQIFTDGLEDTVDIEARVEQQFERLKETMLNELELVKKQLLNKLLTSMAQNKSLA